MQLPTTHENFCLSKAIANIEGVLNVNVAVFFDSFKYSLGC
jgi:hypothetical protein